MHRSDHIRSTFLFYFYVLTRVCLSYDYSELEALGVTCPERDSCSGYRHDRGYMDRNCECDSACSSYGDCCIDAHRRSTTLGTVQRNDATCLNYGWDSHTGIYVIARCNDEWNGPHQVRQKCEGPSDFSDPLSDAPATNVAQSVTYKNIFCAECNNADMQSLTTFDINLLCHGLDTESEEQVLNDIFYDHRRGSWGVTRLDVKGNPTFVECGIIFDVPPGHAESSVRFCRANVVSACAGDWTRPAVEAKCEEYMAVVRGRGTLYRNPHCAICNHESVEDIACGAGERLANLERLIQATGSGAGKVGARRTAKTFMKQCPDGHKYDPFFKRCRMLVCALPGYEVVNGKCAPEGR